MARPENDRSEAVPGGDADVVIHTSLHSSSSGHYELGIVPVSGTPNGWRQRDRVQLTAVSGAGLWEFDSMNEPALR